MAYLRVDRNGFNVKPLSERYNKVDIEKDQIPITQKPSNNSDLFNSIVDDTVERIIKAKEKKAPVMLTMGAHTIKNCMAPTIIKLMEEGWLTHLATNGAGIIHDWEFAYQGVSSEDVKANVEMGQFGIWDETGKYINLALVVGAFENKGYGESVGSMIHNEGVQIPTEEEIDQIVKNYSSDPEKAAAALDLLDTIKKFNLPSGWMEIPFPHKQYCIQAAAYKLGVPFTGHPMIGHDIIYTHPLNHGAAIGRTALHDFLTFANQVNQLDNGVYMSVGSAVM